MNCDGAADYVELVRANRFTPPRELRKDIPVSLEAICLKAMATLRENRYQKAGELAEDIDRWIAGDPVIAYPEGVFKRMERWGRKNFTALASGFALLTSLTLGLAWMNRTVRLERDQARASESRAIESRKLASSAIEKVVEQIGDNSLAQIPGMEEKRHEMLERIIEKITELNATHPDDHAVKADLVRTRLRLANIDHSKRLYAPALEQFRSIRQVIASVPANYRNRDPELRDEWDSLEIDCSFYFCQTLIRAEGPRAALELNQSIEPLAETYMRRNRGALQPALAYSRNRAQAAEICLDLKQVTKAQELVAQAIESLTPHVAVKRDATDAELPDDPQQQELASGLMFLTSALFLDSNCRSAQGDFDGAMKRYEEVERTAKRIQGFEIGRATGTNFLGRMYREMHLLLLKQAKFDRADSIHDSAMQILERRDDSSRPKRLDQLFVITECDRARFRCRQSPEVARHALERAEKVYDSVFATDDSTKDWELALHLATARVAIAVASRDAESRTLAEQEHQQARQKIAEANPTSPLLEELDLSKINSN